VSVLFAFGQMLHVTLIDHILGPVPTTQTPGSQLRVTKTARGAEVFEGAPCKRGTTLKYLSTRSCVKCARDAAARQLERRRQARAASKGVQP